jgi:ribosomal protein L22
MPMLAERKSRSSFHLVVGVEAVQQALGEVLRELPIGVVEYHRELVATQAEGHVRLPQVVAQAFADLLEQGIADGMAEAVVDRLEVVQVDVEQGRARMPWARCRASGSSSLKALRLPRPVRASR